MVSLWGQGKKLILTKLNEAYAYNTALIILLIEVKILQFSKTSQQKAADPERRHLTLNYPNARKQMNRKVLKGFEILLHSTSL